MIKYGERGDKLYLIRYGKVKVLRPDDKGGRIEVAKLGRGSFVGERALIAGEALLRKAGNHWYGSVSAEESRGAKLWGCVCCLSAHQGRSRAERGGSFAERRTLITEVLGDKVLSRQGGETHSDHQNFLNRRLVKAGHRLCRTGACVPEWVEVLAKPQRFGLQLLRAAQAVTTLCQPLAGLDISLPSAGKMCSIPPEE